MRIILTYIFLIVTSIETLSACKLWSVIVKSGYTIPSLHSHEKAGIMNQLSAFYYQSNFMLNGWSLLCYGNEGQDSLVPLHRSSQTAASDSLLYWNTVDSLLSYNGGRIGIGHLRAATSGAYSIPNPHPWIYLKDNIAFSLIHNGSVNKNILYDLLTQNGSDISWLDANPPQSFGSGNWQSTGWDNVVDSELILLYVMKKIEFSNDLIQGFQSALNDLINSGISAHQLNLIFSDGNSVLIFGGESGLSIKESDELYSIMTQPPSNEDINNWHGLGHQEMIVFDGQSITYFPDFITTSIKDEISLTPSKFSIYAPYPNPFNGTIYFELEGETYSPINITIFSIQGLKVDHYRIPALKNERKKLGWEPNGIIASGTYFINASADGNKQTRKILFNK